jgi:Flp pilus assembly protein TadG
MLETMRRKLMAGATFVQDERGVTATIFAILMLPLFGIVGFALDYSRASSARAELQNAADSTALAVVRLVTPGDTQAANAFLAAAGSNGSPVPDAQPVTYTGKWLNMNQYEVIATANVKTVMAHAIPGVSQQMAIKSRAVAETNTSQIKTIKPPAMAVLDPEAGDFNRMYVYCFDYEKRNNADKGRSKMTALSDNAGGLYNNPMPECTTDETVSYRLFNVRGGRSTAQGMAQAARTTWMGQGREIYNWHTDSTCKGPGNETTSKCDVTKKVDFNFNPTVALLETVQCKTMAVCKTGKGGVIPSGKNRTPQQTTADCKPGEFRYFGWEDRPPGFGWTDRDYDDIRLIIECPPDVQFKTVRRLVK